MNYKTISIVIPVYNEEAYIASVVHRVKNSDTLGLKKEIIAVNDGSTDKTLNILTKIKKESNGKKNILLVIDKKNNGGKGSALKQGIIKSTGDIVLIQDADLEYNPADYPKLLQPFFENDADCVYGSRLITAAPHRVLYFWHYVVNQLLTLLSNMLTDLNLSDMETGYKVFKGELIRSIAPNLESRGFGFEPEITARISKIKYLKIFEVGISYSGRTYSEGKKINWKDGAKAVWEIIKYNLLT